MSEVRMSLQEYNEMKEKMDRSDRILNALITPAPVSEWDIKYHNDHPGHSFYLSSSPLENISPEDREYLKSQIYKRASVLAEEQFVSRDMAMMFEISLDLHIGYLKDIEEPQQEKEDDAV